MKTRHVVFTILLGLPLAGCRSDPSKDLLERDNWNKEQQIYRLQARVNELEETLNAGQPATRSVRTVPRGEMPPEPGTIDGGRTAPPANQPDRRHAEPDIQLPGGLNLSPGTEGPPGEVPERMRVPAGTPPARPIAPPAAPTGGFSTDISPQWKPAEGPRAVNSPRTENGTLAETGALAEKGAVAQITLHPSLTGGIGTNGHAGDEGLLVVVEPRDFAGNIINVPGKISVALLDPALNGEQARLARWDFSAGETQTMMRAGSQPGIHLRLPWVSTPAHDRLKVFVRYSTRDGKLLQTERLIGVAVNDPSPLLREVPLEPAKPPETASRPQWSPVR
jgi:hypothetical protein